MTMSQIVRLRFHFANMHQLLPEGDGVSYQAHEVYDRRWFEIQRSGNKALDFRLGGKFSLPQPSNSNPNLDDVDLEPRARYFGK